MTPEEIDHSLHQVAELMKSKELPPLPWFWSHQEGGALIGTSDLPAREKVMYGGPLVCETVRPTPGLLIMHLTALAPLLLSLAESPPPTPQQWQAMNKANERQRTALAAIRIVTAEGNGTPAWQAEQCRRIIALEFYEGLQQDELPQ